MRHYACISTVYVALLATVNIANIKNHLCRTATSEMKTMDPLETIFGKTAQMTVLKNLIERQNEPTYLSGIAEETGLSHSSVSRVITPLVVSGVILEKPLGKQIRTFQLNMESEATNVIIDFYSKINQVIDKSE
jgi:DNA-binding transcriptional regulator GbsR (MarR family)